MLKTTGTIICAFLFSISFHEVQGQIYLELAQTTDMTLAEIVAQTELYFDNVGREKGQGYTPFQRWKYEMERSLDNNGRIVSRETQLKNYQKFMKDNPPNRDFDMLFTEMGPKAATNTSTWSSALGRLSAVGLDINDANHIIAGSPTGGIWRTIDGGTNWAPIYDYALNININSLEISHSNPDHYFAGTSAQILYSTDAGVTWNQAITGPVNTEINTITMDPSDATVLLATDRFAGRIWRSMNGGVDWSIVQTPGGATYDIEFKPGNSNIVYASGSGFISKSSDNGVTWANIAGGPWGGGVIMLAVSPANANYVYALQEVGGGYNATFRSIDSGVNWTTRSDNSSGTNNILTYNQAAAGGQAPRDMDICVSPTNVNHVYVAGTELWKSTNSGTTFVKVADWLVNSALPFIHADVDLLYYTAHGLYAGTDGGLFISTDAAGTFTDMTEGIGVRQFYRIGASQTEVDRVSGGSQDNGTGVIKSGTWYDYAGADGMESFIDWSNKDILYGNEQYGHLFKSTNGGTSIFFTAQTQSGDPGAWVTPTEQDPNVSTTIYQAKKEVWKSTNGGTTWSTISAIGMAGNCDELEIAPSNSNYIYASWGGSLYRTTNGGTTWSDISPGGTINYIDVHPTDPNRVAVAQSGAIRESTDGGTTWSVITSNLPGITYWCVLYENDGNLGMFVSGSPGIWHKDNTTGGLWANRSANLPVVQVRELEIRNGTLYAATYGRGLWKGSLGPKRGFTCAAPLEISEPGTYTSPGPSQGNGCNNCSGNAVHANWYKYIPMVTGTANIYSCYAGVDTRMWVYSGNCGSLTQIASNDDACPITYNSPSNWASRVDNVPITAGEALFIEWDNHWTPNSFFWTLEVNGSCPGNFAGPNTLTGLQNSSADYETNGAIQSTQLITGASTVVDYDSGISIELLANFQVAVGAIFHAFIDGCGGAAAKNENVDSGKK